MRLINADEFREIILTYGKAGYRALLIEKISELIDSQSTAYDVDKVVEQLEAESERWKESGEAYEDQKELGVSEGFKKAIEIAKSGGIG